MSKIDISYYSDIGKRTNNEDAVFAQNTASGGLLAIVCDGVGGYTDGELASKTAIEVISSQLVDAKLNSDTVENAIIDANQAVNSIHSGEESPKTTVALLWIEGNSALAVNIGDSRIYQLREEKILFQSRDHSIPQLAHMAGEITAEQIRSHPQKNRITKCLGSEGPVEMNRKRLQVMHGDRFILCSDGFWGPVLERDMIQTMQQSKNVNEWLNSMRAIAVKVEQDNHTAVAIQIN